MEGSGKKISTCHQTLNSMNVEIYCIHLKILISWCIKYKDHGIWSHHFMANRWGNSGCSKITADGDCSHEIKRRLLLGMKIVTNLDSILKSRDITLPTKVRLVKAMVFPVVMSGRESWTIKKAESQRIDAFWSVVLENTLESPLDCKEIQPVHPKGG